MAKKQKQPRALSIIPTGPQATYRAGLHMELQKYPNPKRTRQLLLTEPAWSELTGSELDEEVRVTGLDLSMPEDRAVGAIQILLDETDYKGHSEHYSAVWDSPLPTLVTTRTAYYEAYGLRRDPSSGRFHGREVEEADQALEALNTTLQRVAYERKHWVKKGRKSECVSDMLVYKTTLIDVIDGYSGLSSAEAGRIRQGEDMPSRSSRLVIVPSPLLIDGIRDFYLRKPKGLYLELVSYFRPGRVPPSVFKFVQWLLTLDLHELRMEREDLAVRIGLGSLVRNRQWTRIERTLERCLSTAKGMGFLLDYGRNDFGLYVFKLNPERMGRKPKSLPKKTETSGQEAAERP